MNRKKIGCLLLVGLLTVCGCGGQQRYALEGTVTLDGQPLDAGTITFLPLPGTGGPSAGANIVAGRFSVDAAQGLLVGKFRVEITAKRKTGRQVQSDTAGGMIDQYEQYIPARFNRESQLTVEVQAGKNQFDFQLTSN